MVFAGWGRLFLSAVPMFVGVSLDFFLDPMRILIDFIVEEFV